MTWPLPPLGDAPTVAADSGMPGPWGPVGTSRACWWPGGVCAAVVERAPDGWRVAVWGRGGASEWRGAMLLPHAVDAFEAQAVAMRILRAWVRA